MRREQHPSARTDIAQVKGKRCEMNSRNLEQVGVFRRYLLKKAARSRSRLMRDQIRRWVEWVDALRDESQHRNEELRRAV